MRSLILLLALTTVVFAEEPATTPRKAPHQAVPGHDHMQQITKPTERVQVHLDDGLEGQTFWVYYDGQEYVGTDKKGKWLWYRWQPPVSDGQGGSGPGYYHFHPLADENAHKEFGAPAPLTIQGIRLMWDRRQKAYVSPDRGNIGKLEVLVFGNEDGSTAVPLSTDLELKLDGPPLPRKADGAKKIEKLGEPKLFAERFNPKRKPWPKGVDKTREGIYLDAAGDVVKPGNWIRNGKVINMPDPNDPANINVVKEPRR